MHVHTGTRRFYLPLYVANGVTGVRDMGGVDRNPPTGNFSFPFDSIGVWRDEIRAGQLLGPWIVAAGIVLDGPVPWPGTLGIANPADARRKVDSLRRVGVDFIKVTNGVPRDSYRAIAAESKRLDIPFVGHTPSAMTARDAATAGQRSIEHLTGLPSACVDRGRCSDIFHVFVTRGTWQVPTLVAWRHVLFRGDSAVSRAPALRYVQRVMRQRWDSTTAVSVSSPADRASARETFERFLRVVRDMNAAGVRLLAGSDAANPYTVPGFSLHEELQWLVAAGLSPAEALRTATLNPAVYFNATDSLGSIGPGKIADLVLLASNPLRDIANTSGIVAVVVHGRLVTPEERRSMLAAVQQQAEDTASAHVRALNQGWADAMVRGDTLFLRRLFSDDLIVTSSSGAVRGKTGELDDVRPRPDLRTHYFRTEDVRVRVYGSAAVVTGLAIWRITYQGTDSDFERRYTSVYTRESGDWKMVALQLTTPARARAP
jgi:ketosteroid isomerase-like protein